MENCRRRCAAAVLENRQKLTNCSIIINIFNSYSQVWLFQQVMPVEKGKYQDLLLSMEMMSFTVMESSFDSAISFSIFLREASTVVWSRPL